MNRIDDYVGIPWVLGGSTPETGLDCWGLCRVVLANHFGVEMNLLEGVAVPTDDRITEFEAVSEYDDWFEVSGLLRPGDVVYFHSKKSGRPSHIGLYIGNDLVLHTMEQGRRGAEIHRLGLLKPYFEKFVFYRNRNATDFSI